MGREGAHLLQMDRLREVRLPKLETNRASLNKFPIAARVSRRHLLDRAKVFFSFEGAVLSLLVPETLLSAPQQDCATVYAPQYRFPPTDPVFVSVTSSR